MKVLEVQKVDLASFCYLNKERYPFLIESVNHNENNRYSILFAFPGKNIVLKSLSEFDFLQKLQDESDEKKLDSTLPFSGGWFVYLSYELIGQIERTLSPKIHNSKLPLAYAVKIPSAIITDHKLNKTYVIDQDNDQVRIDLILADFDLIGEIPSQKIEGSQSEEEEHKFIDGVRKSLDYIKAGDVFQVNLSRQWKYKLNESVDSAVIYSALKKTNPAPFSALIQYENFSIISSSPERLFSVNDSVLETRPIAGTHPRGKGDSDKTQKQNLLSHPKEIAEHVMLLDLERNDMGRVCEYGSVFVNEIMTLETYPFVHHIVSNIKGKIRKHIGIKDIIKALFPGGTITGCPKVRCMEIINELEKMPREAYTGSAGYISQSGKMDFNILIRSFIHKGDVLSFRAGAGIVYDSIPEKELAETRHKAEGLLKIFEKQ